MYALVNENNITTLTKELIEYLVVCFSYCASTLLDPCSCTFTEHDIHDPHSPYGSFTSRFLTLLQFCVLLCVVIYTWYSKISCINFGLFGKYFFVKCCMHCICKVLKTFFAVGLVQVSDMEFKADLTDKICSLVNRYAPDKRWHIDTLTQVRVL